MSVIRVRFFASYAELAGCDSGSVELPLPATVGDVVRQVRARFPGARSIPDRPLTAVNLRHVKLEAPVSAGDEVAFLPPLAGG
jgi:molybdopterin converting factor subunit 1